MDLVTQGKLFFVGRIRGIPVHLHWTLLLIGGFFLVQAALFSPVEWIGWMGALELLCLGSVLLHELAHALRARQLAHEARSIELHAFGGFARISSDHISPRDDIQVSLAGPLANLTLFLVLEVILLAPLPVRLRWLLSTTASFNLAVSLFNLLPALPLDGGSVFLAWLKTRIGSPLAEAYTADLGAGIGAVGLLISVALNQLVLAVVFYTAWSTGRGLRAQAERDHGAGRLPGLLDPLRNVAIRHKVSRRLRELTREANDNRVPTTRTSPRD